MLPQQPQAQSRTQALAVRGEVLPWQPQAQSRTQALAVRGECVTTAAPSPESNTGPSGERQTCYHGAIKQRVEPARIIKKYFKRQSCEFHVT